MPNRISETIKKMFPNEFEELVPVKDHWWQRIDWMPVVDGWKLWAAALLTFVMAVYAIYFYNQFVTMQTQVDTEQAQIEAHLQRRKDLIVNLSKTVMDYSTHESRLFRYISDTRSAKANPQESLKAMIGSLGAEQQKGLQGLLKKVGAGDVKGVKGASLEGMLGSLMALAENYPQLKLSGNFQKLMDALINIEDKIVERRMAYNNACNIYGTYIRQVPQKLFAFIFGFKEYPYVQVDADVRLFNRVHYSEETPILR
ncbi:MAG: LemA protein [Candidatus Omnitrophota bacterium]|jgi:LemA protein